MRFEDLKPHSGFRALIDLIKNHYFADAHDLQRVTEIEHELNLLESRPTAAKDLSLRTLHTELRALTDKLIAKESGDLLAVEGVPLCVLERAVELARMSIPEDEREHPKVGAVILKDDTVISESFRNKDGRGGHAEEIAAQACASAKQIQDAIVITTLEPCTTRGSRGRRPCSEILIRFGVKKVIIGLLDPNPEIRGRCDPLLRKNGIGVGYFPSVLSARIWEMNESFIQSHTNDDFKTVFLYKV
jgi:pyrimidine deaminase RibD-like protein